MFTRAIDIPRSTSEPYYCTQSSWLWLEIHVTLEHAFLSFPITLAHIELYKVA